MSRKSNLKRFKTISDGDMSSSSIISSVSNIEFLDNIGVQLVWAGSPTGQFEVQVSMDYDQDNNGNVINAGNWVSVTLSNSLTYVSTAVGSPIYIDLNQLSAPWIRVKYTRASGSGTLQAYVCAKMI